MSHSRRAAQALVALVEADPAIAMLALWCDHRDADTGPAAATEGRCIRYGPGFATLPLHEAVGLAAHHVLHVALGHGPRMGAMAERMGPEFAPDLWGIACDAVVNEVLLSAGHALPRPALRLSGLIAAAFAPASATADALADWDAERLYLRLVRDGGGASEAGARARAHAAAQGWVPDLAPGADKAGGEDGAEGAEAMARQRVVQALAAGRRAGRGIGRLGSRVAELGAEIAGEPWEVRLRGLVARAVQPGLSDNWARPARAWIAQEAAAVAAGEGRRPAYRPGLRRQTAAPRIVVALDCSTSVGAPALRLCLAETAGIARRSGAEVWLLPFDTVAHRAVRLDPAQGAAMLSDVTLPQGGGTDLAPMLAAAAALDPAIVIVMTDLDAPLPPAPRGLPVIWAVPGPPPVMPGWGIVLDLAR
jgi:hypothetical protein